jgi:hypothetical protein
MKIPPLAYQHPAAWQECLVVAGSGSLEHVHAMTAFSAAFDSLFDGPGVPGWSGASARLEDFCFHVPGAANPGFFVEPFWGNGNEGVMAAFCETSSGRPVLMSVVPFRGPRGSDPADEIAAKVVALRNAKARAVDL